MHVLTRLNVQDTTGAATAVGEQPIKGLLSS